jgi:hypothetical protein
MLPEKDVPAGGVAVPLCGGADDVCGDLPGGAGDGRPAGAAAPPEGADRGGGRRSPGFGGEDLPVHPRPKVSFFNLSLVTVKASATSCMTWMLSTSSA